MYSTRGLWWVAVGPHLDGGDAARAVITPSVPVLSSRQRATSVSCSVYADVCSDLMTSSLPTGPGVLCISATGAGAGAAGGAGQCLLGCASNGDCESIVGGRGHCVGQTCRYDNAVEECCWGCSLKPGASPAYGSICNSVRTQAGCVRLLETCKEDAVYF